MENKNECLIIVDGKIIPDPLRTEIRFFPHQGQVVPILYLDYDLVRTPWEVWLEHHELENRFQKFPKRFRPWR